MKGRRKGWRIVLYVLAGLIVLLVGAVHGALYTPLRNTIIAKVTEPLLNCKVEVGKMRMRFFLTFPDFSVSVNDVSVTYPEPTDTVLGVRSLRARIHVPSLFDGCIDVRKAALTGVKVDFDWRDTAMLKPSQKDTLEEESGPLHLPCMKVDFTIADTHLDILDYVKDGSIALHLDASNSKEGVLDADVTGLCIKAAGLDLDAEIGGRDILGENPRLLIDADALAKLEGFKAFFPEGINAAGEVKLDADGVLAKKGADMLVTVSSDRLRAVTPAGRFAVDDVKIVAGATEGAQNLPKRKHRKGMEVPDFLQEKDFRSSDIDVQLDSTVTSLLKEWNPRGSVHIGSADVRTPMLPLRTRLDALDASVDLNGAVIDSLKLRCGASDLDVRGSLKGVRRMLTGEGKGIYRIDLDVHSNQIQANQLLAALDKGSDSSADTTAVASQLDEEDFESSDTVSDKDTTAHELKLFVIPANVIGDVHVHANKAIYSNLEVRNLNAKAKVAERTVQVTDLQADTEAGSVAADAFYSIRTKKDINAGFALNLHNISVDKVIELIPAVDTLVPILSSLQGNLNCELAATTQLDTLYNPDLKSMNGAFRITGSGLALNEEGVFKTVAKLLLFKDRKQGRIDTLYMSGTVHDNKVTVYPFLLSLDRYSLALGGVQRFDNRFDYKVSLLRSPILLRFGVHLKGKDFSHIEWNLMRAQYKSTNVPKFHEDVDEILLTEKSAIRNVLSNGSDKSLSKGRNAVVHMEEERKDDIAAMDKVSEMSDEQMEMLKTLPKLKEILSRAFQINLKNNPAR